MNQLEQRALAAYYSNARGPEQCSTVETVECNGLTYIRLSGEAGILAVYRVRTVNGQQVLKGMRRWPKALEV